MPTARATLSGHLLAEASSYETVEGNIYFPPSSLTKDGVSWTETDLKTGCPWKGTASYYDVEVKEGGKKVKNGAWFYPAPLEKARNIKDYVAFCKYDCLRCCVVVVAVENVC